MTTSPSVNQNPPITEDWLREAGFKWSDVPRSGKHWTLWLGWALREGDGRMFSSAEDLGIELASNNIGTPGFWFCWLRSDCAHRYARFLHVRHLTTQADVIQLVEALTGYPWKPENHFYGFVRTDEHAAILRKEQERFDQRLIREGPAWREIEKDEARGYPLIEHQRLIDGKD